MNYIKLTVLGLLLVFGVACEKDIDLKLPDQESLLTIQSIFRPDMPWKFDISKSEFTGRSTDFKPINNATIEIYNGTTLLTRVTDHSGETPGQYISTEHQPKLGQSYTIKVSAPGFSDVEAHSMIPMELAQNLDLQFPASGVTEFRRSAVLEFDDVSSERNYYHIVLETRTVEWRWENGDTIYDRSAYEEINVNLPDQDNGLVDVASEAELFQSFFADVRGAMFSDETFNGARFRFNFEVFKRSPSEVSAQSFLEYRAQVRHVSEDYYKYFRSIVLQERTAEDPFAEPTFIYNNVEKGLGNFSGYNKVSSSVISIR